MAVPKDSIEAALELLDGVDTSLPTAPFGDRSNTFSTSEDAKDPLSFTKFEVAESKEDNFQCSIKDLKLRNDRLRCWVRFYREKLRNVDKIFHIIPDYEREKQKNLELQLAYDQRSREWSQQHEQLINLLNEIEPLRERLKVAEELAELAKERAEKHSILEESMHQTIQQLEAKIAHLHSMSNPLFVETTVKKINQLRVITKRLRSEIEDKNTEVADLKSFIRDKNTQVEKTTKKIHWALNLASTLLKLVPTEKISSILNSSEALERFEKHFGESKELIQIQYDSFRRIEEKRLAGRKVELRCIPSFESWIDDFDREQPQMDCEVASNASGGSDVEQDAYDLEQLLNSTQTKEEVDLDSSSDEESTKVLRTKGQASYSSPKKKLEMPQIEWVEPTKESKELNYSHKKPLTPQAKKADSFKEAQTTPLKSRQVSSQIPKPPSATEDLEMVVSPSKRLSRISEQDSKGSKSFQLTKAQLKEVERRRRSVTNKLKEDPSPTKEASKPNMEVNSILDFDSLSQKKKRGRPRKHTAQPSPKRQKGSSTSSSQEDASPSAQLEGNMPDLMLFDDASSEVVSSPRLQKNECATPTKPHGNETGRLRGPQVTLKGLLDSSDSEDEKNYPENKENLFSPVKKIKKSLNTKTTPTRFVRGRGQSLIGSTEEAKPSPKNLIDLPSARDKMGINKAKDNLNNRSKKPVYSENVQSDVHVDASKKLVVNSFPSPKSPEINTRSRSRKHSLCNVVTRSMRKNRIVSDSDDESDSNASSARQTVRNITREINSSPKKIESNRSLRKNRVDSVAPKKVNLPSLLNEKVDNADKNPAKVPGKSTLETTSKSSEVFLPPNNIEAKAKNSVGNSSKNNSVLNDTHKKSSNSNTMLSNSPIDSESKKASDLLSIRKIIEELTLPPLRHSETDIVDLPDVETHREKHSPDRLLEICGLNTSFDLSDSDEEADTQDSSLHIVDSTDGHSSPVPSANNSDQSTNLPSAPCIEANQNLLSIPNLQSNDESTPYYSELMALSGSLAKPPPSMDPTSAGEPQPNLDTSMPFYGDLAPAKTPARLEGPTSSNPAVSSSPLPHKKTFSFYREISDSSTKSSLEENSAACPPDFIFQDFADPWQEPPTCDFMQDFDLSSSTCDEAVEVSAFPDISKELEEILEPDSSTGANSIDNPSKFSLNEDHAVLTDKINNLLVSLLRSKISRQDIWTFCIKSLVALFPQSPSPTCAEMGVFIRCLLRAILQSDPLLKVEFPPKPSPEIYKITQIVSIMELRLKLNEHALHTIIRACCHQLILCRSLSINVLASLTAWYMYSCSVQYNNAETPKDENYLQCGRTFILDLLFHHKGKAQLALYAASTHSKKMFLRSIKYRYWKNLEKVIAWIAYYGFWQGPTEVRSFIKEAWKKWLSIYDVPAKPKDIVKPLLENLLVASCENRKNSTCALQLMIRWLKPKEAIDCLSASMMEVCKQDASQDQKANVKTLIAEIRKMVVKINWKKGDEEKLMKRLRSLGT